MMLFTIQDRHGSHVILNEAKDLRHRHGSHVILSEAKDLRHRHGSHVILSEAKDLRRWLSAFSARRSFASLRMT